MALDVAARVLNVRLATALPFPMAPEWYWLTAKLAAAAAQCMLAGRSVNLDLDLSCLEAMGSEVADAMLVAPLCQLLLPG